MCAAATEVTPHVPVVEGLAGKMTCRIVLCAGLYEHKHGAHDLIFPSSCLVEGAQEIPSISANEGCFAIKLHPHSCCLDQNHPKAENLPIATKYLLSEMS
jgi:hypothetical protein